MFKQQAYTKNEAINWPIPNYWDVIAMVVVFALIVVVAWGTKQMVAPFHVGQVISISLSPAHLPIYALRTVLRLFIALAFSLIFTFVVGTAAAKNKHAERIIIPIIDVLQSAPVLSFLAITTVGFIAVFHGSMLGPECAAIFAVFTGQVWNMTLSFYQSMRTVPTDLKESAAIFRLSSWQKFWRIEVPFAMPGLLWNMMMSMSGSWFFITACEAFPIGNQNITLPGIGSYISAAIMQANGLAVVYAIFSMLIVIFLYDQLLFRPLVYWSERFKGEADEDGDEPYSFVVDLFQKTKFLRYSSVWLSYLGEWFINPCLFLKRKNNIIEKSYDADNDDAKSKIFSWFYYGILILLLIIASFFIGFFFYNTVTFVEMRHILLLGVFTGMRVMVLIVIASLIWVPIGVWIGLRPHIAAKVQPLVQFLAAFPANLLFPVVAMLFLKYKMNVEIWVAPLMVLGTQWYILFNVIAGASALPKDIKQAASLLRVRGLLKWRRLLLPGIAPYFITGAITAAGGAWNASILAEVITWHNIRLEATGLGAYIVNNVNNVSHVVIGTIVMCIFVLVINRLLWRPLYNMAVERYSVE